MITEDYCSYEVSKLLKEKGFDCECRDYYHIDGHFYSEDFKSNWNNSKGELTLFSAPTHQMAMKWLREKSIYIYVEPFITISSEGYNLEGYKPWVTTFKRNWFNPLNELGKVATQSYEEAVEAALKYSLENLI